MVSYLGVSNSGRTSTGSVTVAGLSFGQVDATASARIDSAACGTVAWASSSAALCLSGGRSEVSTEVTVGGLGGTRYAAFTFDGMPFLSVYFLI